MDIEEWELLPDDGHIEIRDAEEKIYSSKFPTDSKNFIQMNPPKSSTELVGKMGYQGGDSNKQVQSPNVIEPTIPKLRDRELQKKEVAKIPIEIKTTPQKTSEKMRSFDTEGLGAEFDDLKADTPNSNSSKGIKHHPAGAGVRQFEENERPHKESRADPQKVLKENRVQLALGENAEVGLNLWKWSLTGIGAICSFGVAAAGVCIIIFSSQQKNKSAQQNPKLLNYSHDEMIIKHVAQR